MDHIVIIGSSGHARVIIDIVEQEGRFTIAGLVDRFRTVGDQTLGYPILGREEDLPALTARLRLAGAIVAIGDNFVRSRVATRVRELCPDLPFVRATHPKATIGRNVSVGEGAVMMAGATVSPCCTIDRFCILSSNASLDHDSVMEEFSSLAPGATTGGHCRIGRYAAVSIGAVLIHGIGIGEHAVIGAGSIVLTPVESYTVAYGSPAKAVRHRQPGDKYL
jgi:sugar O-acyltransferase (sialic acid O-acetyltransferase NeuD family)